MLKYLQTMRSYIARGWTQGASARDVDGRIILSTRLEAVCWCLSGAWCASDSILNAEIIEARQALRKIESKIGDSSITAWNDAPNRIQAEVLGMLDECIEECVWLEACEKEVEGALETST